MRIAITGGTGFVGRHLARLLVQAGHEVVLIARGKDTRDTSILVLPGASFFSSNLSLKTSLSGVRSPISKSTAACRSAEDFVCEIVIGSLEINLRFIRKGAFS